MRAECRILLVCDSEAVARDLRDELGGELHIAESLSGNEPEVFQLKLDEMIVAADDQLELPERYDLAIVAMSSGGAAQLLSSSHALHVRCTTMLVIADQAESGPAPWKRRSRFDRCLIKPFTQGAFLDRVEQLLVVAMQRIPAVIPDDAYLAFLEDLLEDEHRVVAPVLAPEQGTGFCYPAVTAAFGFTIDDHNLLERLAEMGLCRRTIAHRMRKCPSCASHHLVFGEVCAACESADYRYEPMLKHRACGHVDTLARSRKGSGLACAGCGHPLLVQGADHDRIENQYRCRACGTCAEKTLMLARCLDCHQTCTPERTKELVVHAYELTAQAEEAVASGRIAGYGLAAALRNHQASLHSRSYFLNELSREVSRYRSYGVPASLLLARLEGLEHLRTSAPERFAECADGAWSAVTAVLRKLDVACVWSEDVLAVLLPGTPAEGARLVAQRLEKQLASLRDLPAATVATVSASEAGADAMLRQALALVGVAIDSPDEAFIADELVVIEDDVEAVLDLSELAT